MSDLSILTVLAQVCLLLFLAGLFFKLGSWLKAPRSQAHLPSPGFSGWLKALWSTLLDLAFMRKAIRANFYVGFVAWLMHAVMLVLLIGHARAFGAWSAESVPEYLQPLFIELVPTLLGWLLLACLIFLLARRLTFKLARTLFTLRDAVLYVLLLTAVLAGNFMRLLPAQPEPFEWSPLPGMVLRLEHTPNLAAFAVHAVAVSILIAYLPFSPLIHIVAGLASSLSYYRWRLSVEETLRRVV